MVMVWVVLPSVGERIYCACARASLSKMRLNVRQFVDRSIISFLYASAAHSMSIQEIRKSAAQSQLHTLSCRRQGRYKVDIQPIPKFQLVIASPKIKEED